MARCTVDLSAHTDRVIWCEGFGVLDAVMTLLGIACPPVLSF